MLLKTSRKRSQQMTTKEKDKQLHVPRMQRVYRDSNLQLLQIQYVQIHVYCNQDLRYRVMQHLKTYKQCQTINKHMTAKTKLLHPSLLHPLHAKNQFIVLEVNVVKTEHKLISLLSNFS